MMGVLIPVLHLALQGALELSPPRLDGKPG